MGQADKKIEEVGKKTNEVERKISEGRKKIDEAEKKTNGVKRKYIHTFDVCDECFVNEDKKKIEETLVGWDEGLPAAMDDGISEDASATAARAGGKAPDPAVDEDVGDDASVFAAKWHQCGMLCLLGCVWVRVCFR